MSEPENPQPQPSLSWGARFWLVVVILIGPAYLLWMTGVEGKRMWIVAGLVFLIAGFATLAHWLMGKARQR